MEKPTECWILKRVDKSAQFPVTHGGEPNFTNGIFKNVPMSRIIEELNIFTKVEPIIDETNITSNVDMILDIDFNWNVY